MRYLIGCQIYDGYKPFVRQTFSFSLLDGLDQFSLIYNSDKGAND